MTEHDQPAAEQPSDPKVAGLLHRMQTTATEIALQLGDGNEELEARLFSSGMNVANLLADIEQLAERLGVDLGEPPETAH